MNYIDGFVLAVPKANKEKFISHAKTVDTLFLDMCALRVMECWGDDVPKGKVNDLYGAVQAQGDEVVCFSWVEWPDKATRDAGMEKMNEMMKQDPLDPRFDQKINPMPFDGKRLIYGGFAAVAELKS